MCAMTSHSIDTRAVHAGRDDLVDLGVHAVPIDLSTTYPSRDSRAEAARLDVLGTGADDGGLPVYARVGNPTVARFEDALADLEGADAGVAFASGMAALSACLLAAVTAGLPHVVAVRPLYGRCTARTTTCSTLACWVPRSPGRRPTEWPTR